MGSVNRGFMGVAHGHYQPGGGHLNTLTSSSSYNRQSGQLRQNNNRGYTTHSNANTYHAQSWGGYGGKSNAAGGFHGGGGGGGSHGAGGGHGGGHGGHR